MEKRKTLQSKLCKYIFFYLLISHYTVIDSKKKFRESVVGSITWYIFFMLSMKKLIFGIFWKYRATPSIGEYTFSSVLSKMIPSTQEKKQTFPQKTKVKKQTFLIGPLDGIYLEAYLLII